MEIRANYGVLIKGVDAKVREVFDQAAETYNIAFPSYMHKLGDDGAEAKVSGLTPAGKLHKRPEGDNYTTNRRFKLYDTDYVHTTYSAELEVTWEMMEDRDFDNVFSETRQLAIASKRWVQQAMFQPLNNGYTTNTSVNGFDITLYGDGVPLFSTVHPRVDGGATQSNASSTGIVLNETNLETARVAITNQLLDDGTPIALMGKFWLVVPTELDKTAKIITMSELRPETANNDVNIYSGGMFDVLSTQYLSSVNGGSNTAWFVLVENTNRVTYVERKLPNIWSRLESNRAMQFKVDARLSVGHSHWIGTYGSKGDGAAYSS